MKFKSSRFGELDINESEISNFGKGLLGFEDYKRYALLKLDDKTPFRWLHSLDNENLAFIVIEPLQFMFEYNIEISSEDRNPLELADPADALIYVTVSIPEDAEKMTANLQGPLVINKKNKKAAQIISNDPEHDVRTSILAEIEKRNKRIVEYSESLAAKKQEAAK